MTTPEPRLFPSNINAKPLIWYYRLAARALRNYNFPEDVLHTSSQVTINIPSLDRHNNDSIWNINKPSETAWASREEQLITDMRVKGFSPADVLDLLVFAAASHVRSKNIQYVIARIEKTVQLSCAEPARTATPDRLTGKKIGHRSSRDKY